MKNPRQIELANAFCRDLETAPTNLKHFGILFLASFRPDPLRDPLMEAISPYELLDAWHEDACKHGDAAKLHEKDLKAVTYVRNRSKRLCGYRIRKHTISLNIPP
jgi:hypothetical protein